MDQASVSSDEVNTMTPEEVDITTPDEVRATVTTPDTNSEPMSITSKNFESPTGVPNYNIKVNDEDKCIEPVSVPRRIRDYRHLRPRLSFEPYSSA